MLTVLISIFNLLGTPEVGGLTTIQSLEIIQGCKGMNIVGGDLVEVCCLKRKVEMVITICYVQLELSNPRWACTHTGIVFPLQVNPLYDPHGTTALMGANILFEMLCVLPGVKYY